MAIVLTVFGLVFLMRDAQILTLHDSVSVKWRLAVYGALQFGAIMLLAWLRVEFRTGFGAAGHWRAWTDRRFALACVLIQAAEIGIAMALSKLGRGRFRWIGWMLPSPVFLSALLGLSFALERRLVLSPVSAIETAILLWLTLVCAASIVLSRVGGANEDTAFTGNFALLTGCAALIFVPAGFF